MCIRWNLRTEFYGRCLIPRLFTTATPVNGFGSSKSTTLTMSRNNAKKIQMHLTISKRLNSQSQLQIFKSIKTKRSKKSWVSRILQWKRWWRQNQLTHIKPLRGCIFLNVILKWCILTTCWRKWLQNVALTSQISLSTTSNTFKQSQTDFS